MKKLHYIIGFFALIYFAIYIFYLVAEEPKFSVDINPANYFTKEKIETGKKFINERIAFSITGFILSIILLIILYKSNIFYKIHNFVKHKFRYTFLISLIYTFLIIITINLFLLPLKIFSYYHLKAYKIIVTPVGLFFYDYGIHTILQALMFGIGLGFSIYIYEKSRKLFPFIAGIFFFIASIFFMVIYPVFITPLFNKYTTLNHPELEKSIKQTFKKAGIIVKNLYVMDASKRTLSGNAYVSGLGPTKEIVLYDNLLKDYNKEEILSILAHELGHYIKNHVWLGILIFPVTNPVALIAFFYLFAIIIDRLKKQNKATTLFIPLIIMMLLITIWISMPFVNAGSRRMERDADAYSLSITKNAGAFISSEVKISSKNTYMDYNPGLLYKILYATHPSVVYRIGMGEAYKITNTENIKAIREKNIKIIK